MSQAFRNQFTQLSPNNQLLSVLALLAKQQPAQVITIDPAELESIVYSGEVVTLEWSPEGTLNLRWLPSGSRMFILSTGPAAPSTERKAESWPSMESEIPSRLQHLPGMDPYLSARPPSRPVMTTDDAEMAAREAQTAQRSATQRRAREMRDQPLPMPQPPHPPQ